jgi:hypothetical protein
MFGIRKMKRAKQRRQEKNRRLKKRAQEGPQGGTAAAYRAALDLTPIEQQTKRTARLRTLKRKRNFGDSS